MPKRTNTFRDRFVENLMIGLPNDGFINEMVMPAIPVGREQGDIGKMGDQHHRTDFAVRARGGSGHRLDYNVSSVPYRAEQYVLEHPIDDRDSGLQDAPYDPRRDAAFVLRTMVERIKESRVAALVRTAGNYPAGNVDATAKDWGGAGTPVDDVETAKLAIISETGVSDAQMYGWCSRAVYGKLRRNAQVKELWVNTTPGAAAPQMLNAAQIAQALDLRELYVANVIRNTAKEGATPANEFMWGDTEFGVFHKTGSPGIMVPNFGYQVWLNTEPGGNGQVVVDNYREEAKLSTIIRARMMMDELVTEQRLGYLFQNVLT